MGSVEKPRKLCAASRCVLLAVPEVIELKVEYRTTTGLIRMNNDR